MDQLQRPRQRYSCLKAVHWVRRGELHPCRLVEEAVDITAEAVESTCRFDGCFKHCETQQSAECIASFVLFICKLPVVAGKHISRELSHARRRSCGLHCGLLRS